MKTMARGTMMKPARMVTLFRTDINFVAGTVA